MTLGKWEAEQEEVVSALFFTVADNWKPKISSLEPPTVPHLFEVLGREFINNDALMGLAKRKELTDFKFVVERRVHEQFTRFEEIYKICVEYGMKLSDTDLAWTLLNCLPDGYKKKFQSKLETTPDATLTYDFVKNFAIQRFERSSAWYPSKDSKDPPTPLLSKDDKALHTNNNLQSKPKKPPKGQQKDKKWERGQ